MILGLDYASVDANQRPDLTAARAAGIRFAILRASYAEWPDPTLQRDRNAIRGAGLTFGAYMFPVMGHSHPPPEQQVRVAVQSAGLIPGRDLPLVLDLEFPKGIAATGRTRTEIGEWIGRAVAAIRRDTGVDPMIYSSARVLDGDDRDALVGAADLAIAGCPAWCARYPFATRRPAVLDQRVGHLQAPPVPKALGDTDAWWVHQYAGDALGVPGFTSTVDLNRWNPLRRGAKGTRVLWVQRRLRMVEGRPAVWDDAMDDVVTHWQAVHGLEPDGIIGPATFSALAWAPTR